LPTTGIIMWMVAPAWHTSHWGAYTAEVEGGRLVGVAPHPADPAPSDLLGNIVSGNGRARVTRPMARRGWLEDGPGPDGRRGADGWVALSWDEALDRVAAELRRVIDEHGNEAVYAGSYGWASAGRFHHPQSQLRRFYGLLGGATTSVGTYSNHAAEVALKHVVGSAEDVWRGATSWEVIARDTELLVSFGGLPGKNVSVIPGGVTRHTIPGHLAAGRRRGMEIVVVSPIADDVDPGLDAAWLAARPGTDVAVMLALCHVLVTEDLHDRDFLERCCAGTERFLAYVLGDADGVPKTPEWAQDLSGIPAGELRVLARRMASRRTMINTTWSLQRAAHGEQPVWASIALAALLGQIGLPGGGFGNGYGSLADVGATMSAVRVPALPSRVDPTRSAIPVARVADMLLQPGQPYEFDGERRTYPHARLVHWAGGNPFHHHQDLNRLRRALARTDTIVVQEPHWTAMARHADVVFPASTTLEREDLAAGRNDGWLVAMHKAVDPPGEARSDHAILAGLADRLGVGAAFTEGRSERAWLADLYERLVQRLERAGASAPSFDAFWREGSLELPEREGDQVLLAEFRADPEAHPLRTPSGRIELFSETVAGFGYDDAPGHAAWLESSESPRSQRAQRFPLLLIANNPARRLHSQLDAGDHSQAGKVQGREPIRLHPDDAAGRGIADGDVVRVFNDRGECLAGAVLDGALSPGIAQLSTGAWYDPLDAAGERPLCVHGNVNVLTRDAGTSRLAQGCTGQQVLVDVARHEGPLPPIRAYEAPDGAS
jgi:biotin/methionine sulfoxide reductase